MKSLKRNVFIEYIYTFVCNLQFTRGIWMMYLASKGMNLLQLGYLEVVFHVTSFFMEVPTGVVADLYGRKASRLIGRAMAIAEVVLLLMGTNIWFFSLSFVFAALSYNFESGAGEALLYDSLKATAKEDAFMKINGKKEFVYKLTGTLAFLIGGFLAAKSYEMAYQYTMVFIIISIFITMFFMEPPTEVNQNKKKDLESNAVIKSMKNQIVVSYKTLSNNREILYLYGIFNSFIVFIVTIFYYLQNYLQGLGYTQEYIGFVLAVSSGASAICGVFAWRLEKWLGFQKTLKILPVLISVGIYILAFTPYVAPAFVVLFSLEGIIFVITSDYINKRISSEQRATLLSVESMIFSFYMVVLFPLVGWLGDMLGLQKAFQLMALFSTVLTFINYWIRKRNAS